MATSVLTTIIAAGATAALVSGVTITALKPEAGKSPATSEALSPAFDDEELTRVQSEVEGLRVENRDLRDRLVALEEAALRNPAETTRQAIVAEPTETDLVTKAELDQLMASLASPDGSPVPAKLQAVVTTALEDIREREEAERAEKRQERAVQRRDERLERMRTELGMDDTQVNDMRDLAINVEAQMNEARDAARELGDWGSMRDTMRTMWDESMTQVQSILTPSQYETFEESNMARGLIGGRGPGGGGGGRGGGGNNAGGGQGGGGGRRGR